MQASYEIGTKFTPRHNSKRECTVIDILKTYNAKGDLIKIRYVVQYEFAGQIITDSDVVETTIKMSKI